jgi:hypothetical protein
VFIYALGSRLYARAAGILAALLVAMNAFPVYYSQEARMYAQLAALTVMSLWLLAVLVSSSPNSRRFWGLAGGLAAVNTLGLYTHYTYPFTMLVQGIFFVWWLIGVRHASPSQKRYLLSVYVIANLITLMVFLPWLGTAYDQLTAWPSDDTGVRLAEKLETISAYITFGNTASSLGIMDFLWVGLLFLTFLLPDWYPKPPSNGWRVGLPLVWIGMVCGVLLFSGAYREANLKFLLPAQMGVALLVGRGAYLLWDSGSGSAATPLEMAPRWIAGLAFFMVVSSTYSWLGKLQTDPTFRRDDYRAIAAEIEMHADAQTAVILNAPGQIDVFDYYFNGVAAVYPLPRGLGGDDAATLRETQAIINQHPIVYVVFWGEGERDPNGIVKNTLDTLAYEIESRWYGNVRLVRYGVLESPPTEPDIPLSVRFGEHITLQGYAITGEPQAGLIGITLFWQTDALLESRYKVFVQVLKPDGSLLSQHDSEPANNRALTTVWQIGETVVDNHGILLSPDLPSGTYPIIVGMYELDAPDQRLPVAGSSFYTLERLTLP